MSHTKGAHQVACVSHVFTWASVWRQSVLQFTSVQARARDRVSLEISKL